LAGSDKHIHLLTETRADEFGDDPDCELARLADELSDIAGSWRDQLGSARADVA
jgi:hypothetical protein